jgi:hypothetical protein
MQIAESGSAAELDIMALSPISARRSDLIGSLYCVSQELHEQARKGAGTSAPAVQRCVWRVKPDGGKRGCSCFETSACVSLS